MATDNKNGFKDPYFLSAKFFANQILTAVRYLHRRDVVHCDIKPENILLVTRDSDFLVPHDPEEPEFHLHQVTIGLLYTEALHVRAYT